MLTQKPSAEHIWFWHQLFMKELGKNAPGQAAWEGPAVKFSGFSLPLWWSLIRTPDTCPQKADILEAATADWWPQVKAVQRMGASKMGLSHFTVETHAPNTWGTHKSRHSQVIAVWDLFQCTGGCRLHLLLYGNPNHGVQKFSQITEKTKHFWHWKCFTMVIKALMP